MDAGEVSAPLVVSHTAVSPRNSFARVSSELLGNLDGTCVLVPWERRDGSYVDLARGRKHNVECIPENNRADPVPPRKREWLVFGILGGKADLGKIMVSVDRSPPRGLLTPPAEKKEGKERG